MHDRQGPTKEQMQLLAEQAFRRSAEKNFASRWAMSSCGWRISPRPSNSPRSISRIVGTCPGLYEGEPLPDQSIWQSGNACPPRIWLFREPLIAGMARNRRADGRPGASRGGARSRPPFRIQRRRHALARGRGGLALHPRTKKSPRLRIGVMGLSGAPGRIGRRRCAALAVCAPAALRLRTGSPSSHRPTKKAHDPEVGSWACFGAPGRIRTSDRLIRSQVLYPAELLARLEGAT